MLAFIMFLFGAAVLAFQFKDVASLLTVVGGVMLIASAISMQYHNYFKGREGSE